MIEIPLTKDQVALIDDEDYALVSQYKWQAKKHRNTWYAYASTPCVEGKRKRISMHRTIMGAKLGQQVDHINNNGLDNRRENLRFCTASQNCMNRANTWGASTYKGVAKKGNRWASRIMIGGVYTWLGTFSSEEEAAMVYDAAAKNYYGKFANLNFEEGKSE